MGVLMSHSATVFHRPDIARRLAQQVLVVAAGSAAASGVFLAAPRRTGKSTFLREDLRPALDNLGALVVYADLWANPTADPGAVIVNAIRAELTRNEGVILRLAKAAGLDNFKVGALSFDIDRVGLGKELSLTDALVALSDETQRLIVLVIDEAQHALTSEAGIAALFALKAARDELNSSAHHGLRVVCTGSNRDKLAMLRNSKDQAFFGAPMVSFPLLGRDYVEWFCVQTDLPFALDPEQVWPLFVEAGHRPELLGAAADMLRFDFEADQDSGPQRFCEEVHSQSQEMSQVSLQVIRSLTPIQSAVLRVMAAAQDKYAPFEAATMLRYVHAQRLAGMHEDTLKADVPGVQQALLALQEKKLVWRAARGVYAIEEQAIIELLRAQGLLEGV